MIIRFKFLRKVSVVLTVPAMCRIKQMICRMHSKNVIVDIDMAIVLKVTQCFDAIVGSFDFRFTRATTNTSM
jgi:hypothetical protein